MSNNSLESYERPIYAPSMSLEWMDFKPPIAIVQVKKSMSLPCSPTDSCSSRNSRISEGSNRTKPTHCIMCYKRADVLHYGVPACSTCKTFFRRSLMSERELHCKQKEECSKPPEYWSDPSIAQRLGQCAWCRLARFVSLGMNPCAVAPRDGKELLEYPNVAKLFETTQYLHGHNTLEISDAYRMLRIAPLSDALENVFWRLRRCDAKHRQLRTSEFNPKSRGRFHWGLTDYLRQQMEMKQDIKEMIWAKHEPLRLPTVVVKKEVVEDEEEEEDSKPSVKGNDKRKTLPLFSLQKDWAFVDTVCAIEYVKFFNSVFDIHLDTTDQVLTLQSSVVQLSLLELNHFSWSSGFDRLTYPDGTRKCAGSSRAHCSDALLLRMGALSLTRSELALMKALIVCKADRISMRGRETMEDLTAYLSKASWILTSLCLRKYGETEGIARLTAIVDLFHILEVEKSREMQQHVIEYLDKTEPKVMRDLYFCE